MKLPAQAVASAPRSCGDSGDASDDQLLSLAVARATALMREGVTAVEIKSGYGLSEADEARCLRVARRVGEALPLTVRTTFLWCPCHSAGIRSAGR